MKIKNFLFVGLAFFLTITKSFGTEEKTVIELIEETDTIPVYIELPIIDYEKFNPTSAGISLTEFENDTNELKHITKKTTGRGFDSLMTHIVEEFNKNFHTTKFVLAPIKELPIANKNLMNKEDPNAKLIVIVKIDAKYIYDYLINKPFRNQENQLVLTMKYFGGFSYDFYLIDIQNQAKRSIAMNGGFVYGPKFTITGIPYYVEKLEKLNDSVSIMKHYKDVISERINKHAEKLYKKNTKTKNN